jgi:tetratricopeptide (TPR) repeat protein
MIDSRLIRLLDSSDSDKRKKAVMVLAKSKNPEALPYLKQVYDQDGDAEVRALARKAIAYIRKHSAAAQQAPADDTPDFLRDESSTRQTSPFYGEDEYGQASAEERTGGYTFAENEDILKPQEVEIPRAKVEEARSLVDQAMDWNLRGDNQRAIKHLRKALKINPQLAQDSYTTSLAANLTGMDGYTAIRAIQEDPGKVGETNGGWGATFLDLLIYGMVVLVGVFAMYSFALRELLPTLPDDVAINIEQFQQTGLLISLIIGLAAGIMAIIGLMVNAVAVHVAAVSLLGGEGTYRGLLRRITPFVSIWTALSLGFTAVFWYLLPPLDELGLNIADFDSSEEFLLELGANVPDSVLPVYGVYALLSIIAMIYYLRLVGRAYEFGTLRGCGAVFLGGILLVVISAIFFCGLSFILPLGLSAAM